jgi:hypothetical protein
MPWGYRAVFQFDFLAAIADVSHEVLVINPEDDLWDVTRSVSGLFRKGTRWDIEGVGHGVLKLETDRLVRTIDDFFCGRPRPHVEKVIQG